MRQLDDQFFDCIITHEYEYYWNAFNFFDKNCVISNAVDLRKERMTLYDLNTGQSVFSTVEELHPHPKNDIPIASRDSIQCDNNKCVTCTRSCYHPSLS
jgi:hypothetical protein